MDTDKRVLVAIVLSIAVWLAYEAFLAPPRQAPLPPASGPAQQETAAVPPASPAGLKNPPAALAPAPDTGHMQEPGDAKTVTVHNSLYRMQITDTQAAIASMRLYNYKETLPPPALIAWFRKTFNLGGADLTDRADNHKELIELAPIDILPGAASFVYPDGTLARIDGWRAATDAPVIDAGTSPAQLVFSGTDRTMLQFTKRFEFYPDEYRIAFDLVVANASGQTIEGSPLLEWTAKRPEESGGGFFSGGSLNQHRFSYLIKEHAKKKDLQDIEEEIIIEGTETGWAAVEKKYFISALIPLSKRPAQLRLAGSGRIVSCKLVYPYIQLAPGQSETYRFSLYLGPRDIDILRAQNCSLERTIDLGWFDIIAKPLLLTLKFFNRFLHNYGLSIILLTIVIKILFWPLTNKSFKSMQGMKELQPEINALKEKHKDNREEFARQQMELFRRYKVNPLGGCLPMLLQIPVFIALYRALMDSIELRHATFIPFWINDLSAKDPTYIAPIVMGASMFLQQKMTPTTVDPSQARIMMFMPVIFTFMFLNFPSGLVIYWLVNNLISIAQQVYINRKHSHSGGKQCAPSTSKQKQPKKQ